MWCSGPAELSPLSLTGMGDTSVKKELLLFSQKTLHSWKSRWWMKLYKPWTRPEPHPQPFCGAAASVSLFRSLHAKRNTQLIPNKEGYDHSSN